jgi:hypothetical protein
VLNFDAEEELAAASAGEPYTPSQKVLGRFEALVPRVSGLFRAGDSVIVPAKASAVVPSGEGLLTQAKTGHVGRAWCPTPRAVRAFREAGIAPPAAPPIEVLCRVNHRRFAAELGQPLPGARFAESLGAVIEAVAAPSPTGEWLLKRAFGFAGRGRRKVRAGPLDEGTRAFVLASLAPRAGRGLQVEPWVHRAGDAALHGFLAHTGELTLGEPTVQSMDPTGAWLSTSRAGPGDLADHETHALREAATEAAATLFAAGYFGPFGVDAFRWIDERGQARWNPRCEINARYSMGWAIGMGERRPDREIEKGGLP